MLLDIDVREAARRRIGWCYEHYDRVVVSWSGGKDSTVVLHLALEEAEARGRLPVDVLWLDQEAEWEATVEIARVVRDMPGVRMTWLQVPFRLLNTTSMTGDEEWLHCWGPECDWMRDREPDSQYENVYGEDRFKELLNAAQAHHFGAGGARYAVLTGVRTDESFVRYMSISRRPQMPVYLGIVPAFAADAEAAERLQALPWVRCSPIYDWTLGDVWRGIDEGGWPYNRLYDLMYMAGWQPGLMRVSALCHEFSLGATEGAPELEPETWGRLTERLSAVKDLKHLKNEWLSSPNVLPPEFRTWRAYRDHLFATVLVPGRREAFAEAFARDDAKYGAEPDLLRKVHMIHVAGVARSDPTMTYIDNSLHNHGVALALRVRKGEVAFDEGQARR